MSEEGNSKLMWSKGLECLLTFCNFVTVMCPLDGLQISLLVKNLAVSEYREQLLRHQVLWA